MKAAKACISDLVAQVNGALKGVESVTTALQKAKDQKTKKKGGGKGKGTDQVRQEARGSKGPVLELALWEEGPRQARQMAQNPKVSDMCLARPFLLTSIPWVKNQWKPAAALRLCADAFVQKFEGSELRKKPGRAQKVIPDCLIEKKVGEYICGWFPPAAIASTDCESWAKHKTTSFFATVQNLATTYFEVEAAASVQTHCMGSRTILAAPASLF